MLNIDGNKKKKMRKKSFDYDGTKAAWGFQGDDARGPGQGATTPAWVVPPLPPSAGLSRPRRCFNRASWSRILEGGGGGGGGGIRRSQGVHRVFTGCWQGDMRGWRVETGGREGRDMCPLLPLH